MSHRVTLTDGTNLLLPTPMLSFTQVAMYLKCPAQYKFRYIDGQKTPPGVALVEGSSHHEAFEASNKVQIVSGKGHTTKEVNERFGDEFSKRRKEIEDWTDATAPDGKATPDFIHERGLVIGKTFAEDVMPDYVPVQAERRIVIDVAGIPLQAFTDMETEKQVFDYKVSKSNSPYFHKGAAEKSLQLSIYAKATGKKKVGYIGLLKNKPAEYKMAEATKTPGDWAYAEAVIIGVAKAISAGVFPMCGPDQFLCNPKWCGYWANCRGALLGQPPADKVAVAVATPIKIKTKPKARKAPPKRGSRRKRS